MVVAMFGRAAMIPAGVGAALLTGYAAGVLQPAAAAESEAAGTSSAGGSVQGSVTQLDSNGNGKVHLRVGDSAFAEVYAFGAHVTKFYSNTAKNPILFLSEKAVLDRTKPIRGGIPIIWPQFGPNGPLPSHGFARTSAWKLSTTSTTQDSAEVKYTLESNPETMKIWPHEFKSSYVVKLTKDALECDWQVTNTSSTSLSFTAALHSYFTVTDVASVSLTDFSNLKYDDNLNKHQISDSTGPKLTIVGEVDRVYIKAPNNIAIQDKDGVIRITKDNSLPDAVVWNPAEAKAKSMKDFREDEYKTMVCVEPGAVATPVELAPGATWKTKMILCKDYSSKL